MKDIDKSTVFPVYRLLVGRGGVGGGGGRGGVKDRKGLTCNMIAELTDTKLAMDAS